jgi:CDGSH-type Zn-finger protein/uncharacterized Fe-S cluster protein YjdI
LKTERKIMANIEIVKGKEATILFEGKKCIHSRNCVLSRPDVFVPNVEGEWIYPDRATVAEVAELAHNCPSGAIRYEMNDGSDAEKPPKVNLVRIRENGPLAFHGELNITGKEKSFRATFCRCGASQNKPYCDGGHNTSGFKASGEAAVIESKTLEKRDGEVIINPTLNGPLEVKGSIEVVTGTGKTINRIQETYFCRCGHSGNKPYCDGSHERVGFQAEGVLFPNKKGARLNLTPV